MEELEKLANSVEEFTTCLIDPLKSDTRDREAFGDSLDLIIDKAIEYNQGKVTVYPNLQTLLVKIVQQRLAVQKNRVVCRSQSSFLIRISKDDAIVFPMRPPL